MYGASAIQVITFLCLWLILGALGALPFIALGFAIFWIVRTINRNKKTQLQELIGTEEVRCLGCGAILDVNRQSCQKCGWTWKNDAS
jgi:hypothetical protein